MTEEQADTMLALAIQYGKPDRVLVYEPEPYVTYVWLRWHKASISSQFPDRNLFIKPDGERMVWKVL